MPRIRTIKPEFFTSLTVAGLPLEARLTFIGLWTHCDDEGRCVDDARLIKAALWPLDDRLSSDIELDLKRLSEASLIVRYKLGDRSFLEVRTWREHQRINRPSPSKLPPPPKAITAGPSAEDEQVTGPRAGETQLDPDLTHDSVSTHGAVTDDSHQERKGKEQGKEQGKEPRTGASARRSSPQADALFEQFWTAYPRREAKGAARKAWDKAITRATPETITAGATRYRDQPGRDPQFTAHPATWLNADRWTDEPTRSSRTAAVNGHRHQPYRDPEDPATAYTQGL